MILSRRIKAVLVSMFHILRVSHVLQIVLVIMRFICVFVIHFMAGRRFATKGPRNKNMDKKSLDLTLSP